MAPERPWLSTLTHIGRLINIQLARGEHDVTFDEIYAGLESGELWEDLERKFPGFDHFGLITRAHSKSPQGALAIAALNEASACVDRGREHNDAGIEEDGLALLLSFVLEAIDERLWGDPPPRKELQKEWPSGPWN